MWTLSQEPHPFQEGEALRYNSISASMGELWYKQRQSTVMTYTPFAARETEDQCSHVACSKLAVLCLTTLETAYSLDRCFGEVHRHRNVLKGGDDLLGMLMGSRGWGKVTLLSPNKIIRT